MTSWPDMLKCAVATIALCVWLLPATAGAQNLQENIQLKEVQIAAGAFSLADPIPAWVELIAIPKRLPRDELVRSVEIAATN